MSRISNRWGVLLSQEPPLNPWPTDFFPKWCSTKREAIDLIRALRKLGGDARLRDVEKKAYIEVP